MLHAPPSLTHPQGYQRAAVVVLNQRTREAKVCIYYVRFHFLHALLQQLAAVIIQFSTSSSHLNLFFLS